MKSIKKITFSILLTIISSEISAIIKKVESRDRKTIGYFDSKSKIYAEHSPNGYSTYDENKAKLENSHTAFKILEKQYKNIKKEK